MLDSCFDMHLSLSPQHVQHDAYPSLFLDTVVLGCVLELALLDAPGVIARGLAKVAHQPYHVDTIELAIGTTHT